MVRGRPRPQRAAHEPVAGRIAVPTGGGSARALVYRPQSSYPRCQRAKKSPGGTLPPGLLYPGRKASYTCPPTEKSIERLVLRTPAVSLHELPVEPFTAASEGDGARRFATNGRDGAFTRRKVDGNDVCVRIHVRAKFTPARSACQSTFRDIGRAALFQKWNGIRVGSSDAWRTFGSLPSSGALRSADRPPVRHCIRHLDSVP